MAGCSIRGAGGAFPCPHLSTSAYLTRDGRSRALTPQHVIADLPVRMLTRALGVQARCEPTMATFEIEDGDTLVLTDAGNRRLIVRQFGRDDLEGVAWRSAAHRTFSLARVGAAVFFALALLCVR